MAKRILIIGAGASGLMAGICAARSGANVTILEKNDKPGKKILASGNGKCNLTNLRFDYSNLRGTDAGFAKNVIRRFSPEETIQFFSALGVLTIDRDGWVYPITDQSSTVLRLLQMEADHLRVKIKTNETVRDIYYDNYMYVAKTDSWEYKADALIVACGTPASAVQGSSNDALRFAQSMEHHFIPFQPALVPLKLKGNQFSKWTGVRFRGKITLLINEQEMLSDEGILQTTDYGISGIPVFQISRFAVRALNEGNKSVKVSIDFVPSFSFDELCKELHRRHTTSPYKSIRQLLSGVLPEKLIPFIVPKDGKVTEAQLRAITNKLKDLTIDVKGSAGLKNAQICSGGIAVTNLTENLESKLKKDLYFIGEAVDVDGPCGGYNLQWAWSSGYVAGHAAAK